MDENSTRKGVENSEGSEEDVKQMEESRQLETQEEEEDEEEEEMLQSTESQDIRCAVRVPSYTGSSSVELTAGSPMDVVVTVANRAQRDALAGSYRVEYVLAHLAVGQPAFFVQNFTGAQYNRTVRPGDTISLPYRLFPGVDLENRDYNFVLQVFYVGEEETFLATPLNTTATILSISRTSSQLSRFMIGVSLLAALLVAIFVRW
eukprot:CAMPEP_0201484558 /NCGR_PEP_ID=MMETSP0151_2-20130828/8725_1 /ASSEMBLY_ACC=CAM_ASM_000257 /TAXON_ID=200890 /ORGANISM="Paramoeba atlantica, Strain 621/1 / CCAP 1560/9" /LENGTH=204 /DNA_ID=CAMNT_0047868275 /DNA_START=222 /DNA_END=833 /DNA_ORIENTATION=+